MLVTPCSGTHSSKKTDEWVTPRTLGTVRDGSFSAERIVDRIIRDIYVYSIVTNPLQEACLEMWYICQHCSAGANSNN